MILFDVPRPWLPAELGGEGADSPGPPVTRQLSDIRQGGSRSPQPHGRIMSGRMRPGPVLGSPPQVKQSYAQVTEVKRSTPIVGVAVLAMDLPEVNREGAPRQYQWTPSKLGARGPARY